MNKDIPVFSISALAQYPNRKKFIFSGAVVPVRFMRHEMEKALHEEMIKHIPEGFTIVNILAGSLFFAPDPTNVIPK